MFSGSLSTYTNLQTASDYPMIDVNILAGRSTQIMCFKVPLVSIKQCLQIFWRKRKEMTSASSNVVALLAEQNSEAGKSGKCLPEQEDKMDKSVIRLNCDADEAGRRKKRLDSIGNILETIDREHELKPMFIKCGEQEGVAEATSLLTGEDNGSETFGIKRTRDGLQGLEPGPGKIGRRQGKRDRKVGSYFCYSLLITYLSEC